MHNAIPSSRVNRVLRSDGTKSVIVPIDDSLISGAISGLNHPLSLVKDVAKGSPDAILAFPGQFIASDNALISRKIARIVNVTGSIAGQNHVRKVMVSSVEHAIRVGADCVAVHLNIGSTYEPSMLKATGSTVERASNYGVPTMAIIYPRSEGGINGDENYLHLRNEDPRAYTDMINHCVRIASDLGATFVKTQYPGRPDLLEFVCSSNPSIPVFVAGGPRLPRTDALRVAREVGSTSAAGVSFGRNTYGRKDVAQFVKDCRRAMRGSTRDPK